MTIRLIILDRDGVINRDLGTYVTCPEEFEFIDGAIPAIACLKQAGFKIAIATNQAGIERGYYSHETLSAIHDKMLSEIRAGGGDVNQIIYCPSYDNTHPWRKPNAGMLTELLNSFNMNANETVFIGDSVRDMQAGMTVGCRLIKINDRYGNNNIDKMTEELKKQVIFTDNLTTATAYLLQGKSIK